MEINKIIQGDCLEIMKTYQDKSIDVIITDPVWPNALNELKGSEDPYGLFSKAVLEFARIAKTVVIHLGCTSDIRFLATMPKSLPYIRTCWLRYNFPSCRGRILIGSDVAYVFGQPPKARKGHKLLPGECNIKDNDMAISTIIKRKSHPTPRKIGHVLWLVDKFSSPGDIILDPFNGSGTTTLAAYTLGRKYIGIELEQKYCKLAENRLKQQVLNF